MSGRCSNATRQLLSQGRGQFASNSGNGDSSALQNYKSSSMKSPIPPRLCGYYISFILHFNCMQRPPGPRRARQPSEQCGGHTFMSFRQIMEAHALQPDLEIIQSP